MWLIVKKYAVYVVLLIAVSLFGYELLTGNEGTGTKELPSVNSEVMELIAAQETGKRQVKNQPAAPSVTATLPAMPAAAAVATHESASQSTQVPVPSSSSKPSEKPASSLSTPTSSQKPSGKTLVHLNTAGLKDLINLPGIGETRARAIVEYRQSNGGFKNVDELEKVKGIGAKTMEMLRPLVTVD